jgi:hypothetical protein
MAKLVYGDFIEFDATTQGEGFGPNKDSKVECRRCGSCPV